MNKEQLLKLREQYMRKMIPHVLAIKAKELGVRQTNKSAWRTLVASVKNELDSHYDEITPIEAVKEMSFNNKPINLSIPHKNNLLDNDKIVNEIRGITFQTREWIRGTRLDLLGRVSQCACVLETMLIENEIKVYQKMPFVINGHIYFSDIFLPEYDIAIEICGGRKAKIIHSKKFAQRLSDYFNRHIRVVSITSEQAKDPKYFENKILTLL